MTFTLHHRGGNKANTLGLMDLGTFIKPGSVGIEFGSFAGESARILCASGNIKKLYCVDPWDMHPGGGVYRRNGATATRSEIETEFDRITAGLPVVKFKGLSSEFWKKHKGKLQADFVYIDAMHDYEHVRQDICYALDLLKPGGSISGHDYSTRYAGLRKAVKERFGRPDVLFSDKSWLVFLDRRAGM
jgi:hypothetical protein